MNPLNSALHTSYNPTLAIVVYQNKEGEHGSTPFYLESHAINDAGQLLEGRPLKSETIAGMVEVFRDRHQQETRISGDIPQNLLHYTPGTGGEYTMIWHCAASQKMLHFTAEVKLKSGPAHVPPLLFIATASTLKVFALPSARRPGPKTKIRFAPFHNVNTHGRVCLGSAKVKLPAVKTFENLIAYWEEMFWGSKFSAVHNDGAVSGGLTALWKSLLRKPATPFPMAKLNPSTITYQSLINGRA